MIVPGITKKNLIEGVKIIRDGLINRFTVEELSIFCNSFCNKSMENNILSELETLANSMGNNNNPLEHNFVAKLKNKAKSEMVGGGGFLSRACNCRRTARTPPPNNENSSLSSALNAMNQQGESKTTTSQVLNVALGDLLNKAQEGELTQADMNLLLTTRTIESALQIQQEQSRVVNQEMSFREREFASSQNRQLYNDFMSLGATGLAGYLAYQILNLVQAAPTLVVKFAGRVFILLCILITNIFGTVINNSLGRLPVIGSSVQVPSGRNMTYDIIGAINETIRNNPEASATMDELAQLGFTTYMIAFIILFIGLNFFTHMVRMLTMANSASVQILGTGITIGNVSNNNRLNLTNLDNMSSRLENSQLQTLQNRAQSQELQVNSRPTTNTSPASLLHGHSTPALTNNGGRKKRKHKRKSKKRRKRKSRKTRVQHKKKSKKRIGKRKNKRRTRSKKR